MTRLTYLEVSGFRAFPKSVTFDLDSDVVLLSGPNGTGKTSLFDAVLWALSGRVGRLDSHRGDVYSLYSESGVTRVALSLSDSAGRDWRIVRTDDGSGQALTMSLNGDLREGALAQEKLLQELWPEALLAEDSQESFETALTRGVYLQQDLVRQFLESDTDEARFEMVGELVGAGRVTEFQRQLDSARTAWTRARTRLEQETEAARLRVEQLTSRMAWLRDSSPGQDATVARWKKWWSRVTALGIDGSAAELDLTNAPVAVAEVLQVIQARRRSAQRRRVDIEAALAELAVLPDVSFLRRNVASQRSSLEEVGQRLGAARSQLLTAQSEASVARGRLAIERERAEEMKVLAQLALRHLEDRCPVCQQGYDEAFTRQHLLGMLQPGEPEDDSEFEHSIRVAADEVASLEAQFASESLEMASAEAALAAAEAAAQALQLALLELGIQDHEDATQQLHRQLLELDKELSQSSSLYREGEELSLDAARLVEAAQRSDVERQLADAVRVYQVLEKRLQLHGEVRDMAQTLLERTREAAREIVERQVESIEPLVGRIYARVDPHPGFKVVKLLTAYYRGRGRITPMVADPSAAFPDQDPFPVFSSSQLNALAVSVFLGLNLGVPSVPLEVAMMDDPLQSLDDVNLLGLVDTLRRTRAHRQLIVSTHDPRFARLLLRKLRPVGSIERTTVIQFKGWSKEGPALSQRTLEPEPATVKVAAA